MKFTVLYRGPLRICNFHCDYCPFVSEFLDSDNIPHIQQDKEYLKDFVKWIESQPLNDDDSISLFFAPAGEILIFEHYIQAIDRLKNLRGVDEIVIQTNCSFKLEIIEKFTPKLKLWITFHPEKMELSEFIEKLTFFDEKGVQYSVGMVGTKEHLPIIQQLRQQLNPNVYLWVNAMKSSSHYYSEDDISQILEIDPYFRYELDSICMRGKLCNTGYSVFLIDSGKIRRCILDKTILGTIEEHNLKDFTRPLPCMYNSECNCYISYSHNGQTAIDKNFSSGKLARIPYGFKYTS